MREGEEREREKERINRSALYFSKFVNINESKPHT